MMHDKRQVGEEVAERELAWRYLTRIESVPNKSLCKSVTSVLCTREHASAKVQNAVRPAEDNGRESL